MNKRKRTPTVSFDSPLQSIGRCGRLLSGGRATTTPPDRADPSLQPTSSRTPFTVTVIPASRPGLPVMCAEGARARRTPDALTIRRSRSTFHGGT
jgi:hypothetical protein